MKNNMELIGNQLRETILTKIDFSLYNLPYGIFSTPEKSKRMGVAIGEYIIDMYEWIKTHTKTYPHIDVNIFHQSTLNGYMKLGSAFHHTIRHQLQKELLTSTSVIYSDNRKRDYELLVKQSDATMYMPIDVRNYTDFYSSIQHATNVGKMFRNPEQALMPNWKHMPIAYHGRASSIRTTGTDFHRPYGQLPQKEGEPPIFGATRRMDFELELGCIIGKQSSLGNIVSPSHAEEYIFGFVLFNDWSARDIQRWEYQPLGPFLGKNFFSAISPWIIPYEAVLPYRVAKPYQDIEPLPYLNHSKSATYDIRLFVDLQTADGLVTTISESNAKYLYWDFFEQIAHHTINGCSLEVGDILATGTISGETQNSFGSMLELSWNGTNPLSLKNGMTRTFLEDGDTIIIRGYAENEHTKIGFGEVRNKILPPISLP